MKQQDITVKAKDDQYPLAATLFEPDSSSVPALKIVCIISGASGVRRGLYTAFATFLTEKYGLTCITYDYRGVGESGSPKGLDAGIVEWCRNDAAGVIEYVAQQFPDHEIVVTGHSVGSHAHGIMYPELNQKVKRLFTVAGNNAYLKYFKWNAVYFMTLLTFYGIRAPVSYLYGFFPSKTLFGMMEDLPTRVVKEWAYFMTNPKYFVEVKDHTKLLHPEGFESLTAPILSFSFETDEISRKEGVDSFHQRFVNSQKVTRIHFPATYKSGHINFFRSSVTDQKLWDMGAQFLVHGALPTVESQPKITSRL